MDKRIDEPESVQFTIYSMHRTKCFHYSAPDGYRNSIIKKINMMFNVGGVTVSTNAPLVNDWIDVSNRSLKRMKFRITDARGKIINLHNAPVSLTLLFVN